MLTFHYNHVSKGSCGIGTSRQTIKRHLLPQTGWCRRAHLLPAPHANIAFSLSGKSIIFQISHYLLSIRSTTISLQINEIIIVWQKSAKRLEYYFKLLHNSRKSRLIDMVTPTQEEATFWEIDLQRLWTRLADGQCWFQSDEGHQGVPQGEIRVSAGRTPHLRWDHYWWLA